MAPVDVHLEVGSSRTFASAVAWPGWSRSARSRDGEEAAIEALTAYADRYAEVARRAGQQLPDPMTMRIIERAPGTTTTDFGAPDVPAAIDAVPLDRAERDRQVDLLIAAWALLDDVVAAAPAELVKGPRGGGRDRDEIVRHVVEAERAYARKAGVKRKPFDPHDRAARDEMRDELVTVLRPADRGSAWMPAYFLRRAAWHVLDHAWEIQDKSS
jgi:hypothetical protein